MNTKKLTALEKEIEIKRLAVIINAQLEFFRIIKA